MIALKGPIKYVRRPSSSSSPGTTNKAPPSPTRPSSPKSPCPSPTLPPESSSPSPSPSSPSYDPKNAVAGQWTWTGHWAFGSSLPEDQQPKIPTTKRRRSNSAAGARPFVYKFFEVVDAKDVEVPSLAATVSAYENEQDNGEGHESIEKKDEHENDWIRGGGGSDGVVDRDVDGAKEQESRSKIKIEDKSSFGDGDRGEKIKEASMLRLKDEDAGSNTVGDHSDRVGGDEEEKTSDTNRNKQEKANAGHFNGDVGGNDGGMVAIDSYKNRKGDLEGNKKIAADSNSNEIRREDDERKKTGNTSTTNESNLGHGDNNQKIIGEKLPRQDDSYGKMKLGDQKANESICINPEKVDPDNNITSKDQGNESKSVHSQASCQESSKDLIIKTATIMDDATTSKLTESSDQEKQEKADDKVSHTKDEVQRETKIDLPSSYDQKGQKNSKLGKSSSGIPLETSFGCDTFTDAGVIHAKKVPVGGCWKGYFQNVSARKDRNSSRCQEVFHLFFNSTPPADARVSFSQPENNTDGLLPDGSIHVRGAGTNQFGTFELLGSYNLVTGVLSCQRIYVSTTDAIESNKKKDKSKLRISTPSRRPYFTRRRPVSWRKTGYDSDSNSGANTLKRANSGRKRQRVGSESASPSKAIDGRTVSLDSGGGKSIINSPTSSTKTLQPLNTKTSVNSAKAKTSAPSGSPKLSPPSSRSKSKPSPVTSTSAAVSPSSTTNHQITIPVSGDHMEARWRGAHFIYYHRHNDGNGNMTGSSSSQCNSMSSSAVVTPSNLSATISFVVYEGEMNNGKNIREGKGICLYNNGTIYEGEWKKNKEHGRGKLVTGDRKRIIYEGDWERGKMHGTGTYYYHMYADSCDAKKMENGGVYKGDFKENARHDMGVYTLTDGSEYDGEWRDNLPSGRGTFRWVDGSVYVGHWKNGKRNGWGQLTCSDRFTYEGMWVDNAMEGRGIAVYPNGQRYEGMWVGGKREGRGTIIFGNGAVYEGRFREDCMEGQGTLKMTRNVAIPVSTISKVDDSDVTSSKTASKGSEDGDKMEIEVEEKDEELDWMIPIGFQGDIGHIHRVAGFTTGGE